jgi:hypothetical protein
LVFTVTPDGDFIAAAIKRPLLKLANFALPEFPGTSRVSRSP